ncbi:MAG: outer membrane lipoprotein carrier protein LolA [Sandaracinaceae bacterium]|jgi:outer membrane lipoprotein carrier protein|nr:outer membrane lipoprotein carrier protein LolA [Sandaracinaceae bacterium]
MKSVAPNHRRSLRKRASMLVAVSLSVAFALLTLHARGYAQNPPAGPRLTAAVVAARVQTFYDQVQDMDARFCQTYRNKLYDRLDRSCGHVVFHKPGQMRWDYDPPSGKILVSDGTRIQIFEPGGQGTPGQVAEVPLAQSELPQALSFLTGTGRMEEQFTLRLLNAAREGFPNGDVLELTPRHANPHFARIQLYVTRVQVGQATAGVVDRVLILEHTGNRNRFDFTSMNYRPTVDMNLFRWTPPAGTRRITR